MFKSESEELTLSNIIQDLSNNNDLEKIVRLCSCTNMQAICDKPLSELSFLEISGALSDVLKFEDGFPDLQKIFKILYDSMEIRILEVDTNYTSNKDKLLKLLDFWTRTLDEEFVAEDMAAPESLRINLILTTLLVLATTEKDFSGRTEIMEGIIDSVINLNEYWRAKFTSINRGLQNVEDKSKDGLITKFQRLVESSLGLSEAKVDCFKSLPETVAKASMLNSGSVELSLSSIVQNSSNDDDLEKIVKFFSYTNIQAISEKPCSTLSLLEISGALSDVLKFEGCFPGLREIFNILYDSMEIRILEVNTNYTSNKDKLRKFLDFWARILDEEFIAEDIAAPESLRIDLILTILLVLTITEKDFSGRTELMESIIDSVSNLNEYWHAKFTSINRGLQNVEDKSKDGLITKFQRLLELSLGLSEAKVGCFKSLPETVAKASMLNSGSVELSLSSIIQNSSNDDDLEKIVKFFSYTNIQAISEKPCSTLSLLEISGALSDVLKFEDGFPDLREIFKILYDSMERRILELDTSYTSNNDKLLKLLECWQQPLDEEFVAEDIAAPETLRIQLIFAALLVLATTEKDFSGRTEIMESVIDSVSNLNEYWHAKFTSINRGLQNIEDKSKDGLITKFQRLVESSLGLSEAKVDHFKNLPETVHEEILSWIDYKTRLSATQVAKKWRLLTCTNWINSVNGPLLTKDEIDDAKAYINCNLNEIDKNLCHLEVVSIQCIPDKMAHVAVEFKSLKNKDEAATKVFSVKSIQQYAEQYRADLCNEDKFQELSICI